MAATAAAPACSSATARPASPLGSTSAAPARRQKGDINCTAPTSRPTGARWPSPRTLTTYQFLSDRAESARRVAFRGLDVGGRVAGGIATVAAAIAEDMRGRVPGQHRKQREGLALLTATMLDVRGANLMDLAASLPRAAERPDMRYQWISRLLGNQLIDADAVMAPYGRELLARLAAEGRTVVLMIDQTRAAARHQVVMVAARVGGRALPLAGRGGTTRGAIGFDEQRGALEAGAGLLPAGARPVLMGDRFYGTPALIGWCRQRGWGWRLRLKRDLLVFEGGGETTLVACLARGERLLRDVELTERRAVTHVAMVHEPGPPEPWIIAMSEPPTVHRAFDYGLRWGIEAMFSDFKTRGFGLEDSQLRRPERLDRLILVMTLALFWAVSTGMWDAVHRATPDEKKPRHSSPATCCAA